MKKVFQQNNTGQTYSSFNILMHVENFVYFFNNSIYKIGNYIQSNRFVALNDKIQYNWLNTTFEAFKI